MDSLEWMFFHCNALVELAEGDAETQELLMSCHGIRAIGRRVRQLIPGNLKTDFFEQEAADASRPRRHRCLAE